VAAPPGAGAAPPVGSREAAEAERLRAQLAGAERRAAVAEARAEERERVIEAQAVALRALGAGPFPQEVSTAPQEARGDPGGRAAPASWPTTAVVAGAG
jgi:hypothetical protein